MFVVCGEALMDVYMGEPTPTGMLLDARIGGSPLNVAQGLARLERPVAFLTGLSTDALGERLLASLRAEGVDTSLVLRSDAPSTLSVLGASLRSTSEVSTPSARSDSSRRSPSASVDRPVRKAAGRPSRARPCATFSGEPPMRASSIRPVGVRSPM